MTVITKNLNQQDASETLTVRLVAGYSKLTESRKARVREMVELFLQSDDVAEQTEIIRGVFEIVAPELTNRKGPAGATANLDEGVSAESRERVRNYREWVGRTIAAKRAEAGLTQVELAKKAGIPQSHVCRLETGVHTPTSRTIKKIADALGIAPGALDVMHDD